MRGIIYSLDARGNVFMPGWDSQVRYGEGNIIPRKTLVAKFHPWANLACFFFQEKIRRYPFFFLSDSPKFYSIKVFYSKNRQIFLEIIEYP
jgi:hypothetical protein